MEFGNRLYDLRKNAGYSQEALAEKLNVTRQTISKWELGESTPDMEKLVAIHDLFNVSMDELMLGEKPNIDTKTCIGFSEIDDSRVYKSKKLIKKIAVILGVFFCIDFISMVIYFIVNGVPK